MISVQEIEEFIHAALLLIRGIIKFFILRNQMDKMEVILVVVGNDRAQRGNKGNEEPSCGHHKTLTAYHVTVYGNHSGKES